jgi:mannosylglycoprotein endo-beta-mannosidase
MGDFNAIMHAGDKSGGDASWPRYQDDFKDCITHSELLQAPYTGLKYSWHNGQHGSQSIQKKLDWVFGNPQLFSTWPATNALFQTHSISDHSAMILSLLSPSKHPHSPFKFLNTWADHRDFIATVATSWQLPVRGNPMYQFTTKLKRLKIDLKLFHRQHSSNITGRVVNAKAKWDAAQFDLNRNPASETTKLTERTLALQYQQLCKDEESYFKQKSRVQWMHLGDRNTSFFHKSLLHRQVRNRIHNLQDDTGNLIHDPQEIGRMASTYFENLLCAPQLPMTEDLTAIFPNTITEASTAAALTSISDDDIKAALFSISDAKAPGPDKYNSLFFKKSWDVIKYDFIAAIKYFFSNNCLPRCVNATRVALVPKQEHPSCLHDFRPISCCNVLYKCIAKLLVIRLKAALVDVIGPSQSAFIPGRNISDAILLTQELMHNYHHNKGPSRCALKIDLKKAFDTVSLDFIIAGLHAIGIPHDMINWIKTCITTVHYTININGELHGFFQATRGIRQGDPLSPYLFVLAMEGLSDIINQSVRSSTFQYHWRCKPTKITHLCFADDLMMFCHADIESIMVLKSSLDRFSKLSGLTINLAKSSLYLSGVDGSLCNNIMDSIGIHEASLPVRYLGVPLISTRLTHTDCLPLVERITSRITLWTSSSLTYAGRLQLIKSVLFSIQVYWSSIFILPCATTKKIESILAAFLWKGTSLSPTRSKVAWNVVCYPLHEGGLGIKRLKAWNQAATIKHIWHLLTDKTSIWTAWVHKILLRGRSFWQLNMPSNPSWSWRKILQTRELCRGWFTSSIGNGSSTFLWYDYWLPEGTRFIDAHPLRTLTSTGLPWNARVSAIIHGRQWQFPRDATSLQASWNSILFYPNPSSEDTYKWTGHPSGKFSIASAWELLRARRPSNNMHQLLWFAGHIPRHSFILWLACLGRLRTMDRLSSAGIIQNATCIFCGLQTETHEHLFFICTTSRQVWETVTARANIYWPCCNWSNLLQWGSTNYCKKNDIQHTIARLVLSTTVYLLWQERNKRVFNSQYQTAPTLAEDIFQQVRSQISTMKFSGRIPNAICNIWGLMDLQTPAW